MILSTLNKVNFEEGNIKLTNPLIQLENLLNELQKRDLPESMVLSINKELKAINTTLQYSEKSLLAKKAQLKILKLIEKELKIVPENYYRKLWLVLGMTTFGLPLGVVMGISFQNMSFISIGLPIGIAVGSNLDKKALQNNQQLNFEVKH